MGLIIFELAGVLLTAVARGNAQEYRKVADEFLKRKLMNGKCIIHNMGLERHSL